MDNHRSYFHHHPKSVEELRQTLLYTAMELETTRLAAQEELKRRDQQLSLVNQLLNRAIKERDEALHKSQKLYFENHRLHLLHHPPPKPSPLSGISGVEEEQPPVIASADCEESIASPAPAKVSLVARKPLPEKGKLLQAVIKAGPLLKTLLLAGPLPQWRHPPPAMEAFEIPPVGIGGCESGGSSGSGSSPTRPYKYQRVGS